MKAYIASSIFTEGERMFLEKVEKLCKECNVEMFMPHKDVGFTEDKRKIFIEDKKGLDESDFVIAIINLNNDIGTAWEIGYAYAKGKRVIAVIDDNRIFDKRQINTIVAESMEIVTSLEELRKKLT